MSTGEESWLVVVVVLVGCTIAGALVLVATKGLAWATSETLAPSLILALFSYVAYATALAVRLTGRGVSPLVSRTRNAAVLTIIILIYGFWLLPSEVRISWIASGIALAVIIQFGSYFFASLRRRVLERLFESSKRKKRKIEQVAPSFEKYFEQHSAVYMALPAGSVLGIIICAILGVSEAEQGLRFCIATILSLLIVFQLGFLVSGIKMVVSRFCVEEEKSAKARVVVDVRAPQCIVVHYPASDSVEDGRDTLIDAAVIATELRRLFLLNQIQQLLVAIPVSVALLHLLGVAFTWGHIVFGIVVAFLAASQIPYIIGQLKTQELLLGARRGLERVKLAEQMRKFAPLYPDSQAWLAYTGSGTAGAISVKMLENLIPTL